MPPSNDIKYAKTTLAWLMREMLWPNGPRNLEADAVGVTLLVSLFKSTNEHKYLAQAIHVVNEVTQVLGRDKGLISGEEAGQDSQDYPNLLMWIYALSQLGKFDPIFHDRAVKIAKEIHPAFFVPARNSVIWRMSDDLSGPYKGFYGYSLTDTLHGYAVYKELDADKLQDELIDLRKAVDKIGQVHMSDLLVAGRMLLSCHLCSREPWARAIMGRIMADLDKLWEDDKGFRDLQAPYANYCVSLGIQAAIKASEDAETDSHGDDMHPLLHKEDRDKWMSRILKLNDIVETYECLSPALDHRLTDLQAGEQGF